MKDGEAVARGLVRLKKNYETVEGADDLSIEYASADLALCAFGVTAYELAACGVPAIYLGLTQDHVASASAFADAGMGISLGLAGQSLRRRYRAHGAMAAEQAGARGAKCAHAGLSLIDGQGAARIAADLAAGAGRGAHRRLKWLRYKRSLPAEDIGPIADADRASRSRRPVRRAHSVRPSAVQLGRKAVFKVGTPAPAASQDTAVGALTTQVQRRQHGASAVQFVLLVDALRHDDLAAADGFQCGDLLGRARHTGRRRRWRRRLAQETAPCFQRRILQSSDGRPGLPLRQQMPIARSCPKMIFPARHLVGIGHQKACAVRESAPGCRANSGAAAHQHRGIGAAGRFQPAIIGDRFAADRS